MIPRTVSQVFAQAYRVQAGDDVGTISAGFTGSVGRYPELVGANAHKPTHSVDGLAFNVFGSLQAGEVLNIPSNWGFGSGVGVGITSLASLGARMTTDQLDSLAGVLCKAYSDVSAALASINVPFFNVSPEHAPYVCKVVASWWPYLSQQMQLPALTEDGVSGWLKQNGVWNLVNIQTIGNVFQHAVAYANKVEQLSSSYANAPDTLRRVAWDRIPWDELSAKWPQLMTAFGNRPEVMLQLAQLLSRFSGAGARASSAAIVAARPRTGVHGAGYVGATSTCATCAAPDFMNVDWNAEPYNSLLTWMAQGYVADPSAIPWDLLMWTGTTDCAISHLDRLSMLQGMSDCIASPMCSYNGTTDPVAKWKALICDVNISQDWCDKCRLASRSPTNIPTQTACVGASCDVDTDCCEGYACQNHVCLPKVEPSTPVIPGLCLKEGVACVGDVCCEGLACKDGKCVAEAATPPVSPPVQPSTAKSIVPWVIGGIVAAAGVGLAIYLGMKDSPRKNPAKKIEGRRNPAGDDYPLDLYKDKYELGAIVDAANAWYSGQGDPLYIIVSGNIRMMDKSQIAWAKRNLDVLGDDFISDEDAMTVSSAIEGLQNIYDDLPDDGSEE